MPTTPGLRRSEAGFSAIEMTIVVVLVAFLATLAFPRIRDGLTRQNLRSARAASQTLVAKARAAAVQRGCRGTLQMRTDGTMWVTVCAAAPVAGRTLDTVGIVEPLGARFSVTITPSRDSIAFDPRGLKIGFERVVVAFNNSATRDSLVVNEVGKVVRQ